MYEYDLILEELNERVECGELTLEEAELINDYAYEAYVLEGNAFNRVAKDNYRKFNKLDNKLTNMDKAWMTLQPKGKAEKLWNQKMDKIKSEYSKAKYSMSDEGDDSPYDISDIYKMSKGDYKSDLRSRIFKQQWMKDHGNKGLSPEKRYTAGRYLKAQKILREQ